mmetsp:Transcript_123197/g.344853  ORF Transcript_123197/g.344853 Transcript_123197/m.344853 type:complete len:211 (-) Transcript_123197:292-924(-)
MTMFTRSMSMPRPKRSVETMMRFWNSLNCLYLVMRSSCARPEWMAMDGKLHSTRSLSKAMARCTDFTKMTTWLNSSASSTSFSFRFFSFSVSLTKYCRRPCRVSLDSSTRISCGSCMNLWQMPRISADMVALNIMTCFFFGVSMKICWMSLRMSSFSKHLSHSSRTNCVNLSSFSSFSRVRASSRPGVPMRMCGQLCCSISLSLAKATPP